MLIANPLYDVVFKYLLEDIEIARGLLSAKDKHQLEFLGDLNDPLVKKMVERLGRAIASEDIRDKMDVEDEIDRIFDRELKKIATEKDKIIEAKDQELEVERQKAEVERQKAEAERQKNETLLRELEELKKQMKK